MYFVSLRSLLETFGYICVSRNLHKQLKNRKFLYKRLEFNKSVQYTQLKGFL